jgi:hypothetical protein
MRTLLEFTVEGATHGDLVKHAREVVMKYLELDTIEQVDDAVDMEMRVGIHEYASMEENPVSATVTVRIR